MLTRMCVFGVCIAVLLATESVLYKSFLSIVQSKNMEYWKQTHQQHIPKQVGKKIRNRKISFESCSFRFLLIKAFYLGFQKVSNCQGWNVELENPPTQKCRDDVSRGKFAMDATPNIVTGRYLSLYANGIIPNSK